MTIEVDNLADDQIKDLERALAAEKREREHAKWDSELVGRYFRVIRVQDSGMATLFGFHPKPAFNDYVTLEESLAVGAGAGQFVFADVSYVYIRSRDEHTLTCSGFQVSHKDRKEPYLKIQPIFFSYDDFRNYLNTWGTGSGPAKHCDEISKAEYDDALSKAISNFTAE